MSDPRIFALIPAAVAVWAAVKGAGPRLRAWRADRDRSFARANRVRVR